MNKYSVKKVAKMSGVTVRTLHYYDKIGLLKPRNRTEKGYRYYGEEELLRLSAAQSPEQEDGSGGRWSRDGAARQKGFR